MKLQNATRNVDARPVRGRSRSTSLSRPIQSAARSVAVMLRDRDEASSAHDGMFAASRAAMFTVRSSLALSLATLVVLACGSESSEPSGSGPDGGTAKADGGDAGPSPDGGGSNVDGGDTGVS